MAPFQFGFRENNSTELAVTTFYDRLLKNLSENEITCSIFLDIRKAYDSVNHEILLFADDTNLHLSHIIINSLQSRVQQELMKVSKWMIGNKLTLNYKKSC